MKKLLFLMTLMMPLLFASCGDDKDEPTSFSKQLVGEWEEINGPELELFHLKFISDHKGLFWITENGVKIEETPFTWAQDGNNVVVTVTVDGETSTGTGIFRDGFLFLYDDTEGIESAIVYKKVK